MELSTSAHFSSTLPATVAAAGTLLSASDAPASSDASPEAGRL
jgi:hypothetical protein